MRDPSKKLIGGVCAGLAKYLNMDVNLVRILAVVITLFTGIPIVLYLIALFVMPEEGPPRRSRRTSTVRSRVPTTPATPGSTPPAAVRVSGSAAGRPGVGYRRCAMGAAADRVAARDVGGRARAPELDPAERTGADCGRAERTGAVCRSSRRGEPTVASRHPEPTGYDTAPATPAADTKADEPGTDKPA